MNRNQAPPEVRLWTFLLSNYLALRLRPGGPRINWGSSTLRRTEKPRLYISVQPGFGSCSKPPSRDALCVAVDQFVLENPGLLQTNSEMLSEAEALAPAVPRRPPDCVMLRTSAASS